jgi:hypothetical protein
VSRAMRLHRPPIFARTVEEAAQHGDGETLAEALDRSANREGRGRETSGRFRRAGASSRVGPPGGPGRTPESGVGLVVLLERCFLKEGGRLRVGGDQAQRLFQPAAGVQAGRAGVAVGLQGDLPLGGRSPPR